MCASTSPQLFKTAPCGPPLLNAPHILSPLFSQALPLIGGTERAIEQMLTNPNGLLGTVRAEAWAHRGRVLLLGDAAHAIVPFFGQGMNCGFEDIFHITRVCFVCAHCIIYYCLF